MKTFSDKVRDIVRKIPKGKTMGARGFRGFQRTTWDPLEGLMSKLRTGYGSRPGPEELS